MDNIKESIKSVDLEKRENMFICKWGKKHEKKRPEEKRFEEETNRTEYRRQRDRILYSGGFRRLQDKTQVIAATKNGDHRTRLTHTLEVEQIATSMADALGLNKHLVSAIALGHDVGHTPFGHAVEGFLNEKLKDKGGFSHAVQSVRYLKNNGVDLSTEVFEGILKHDTDVYADGYDKEQFNCSEYSPLEPGNLEVQVVYWADKLAYLSHDFEDFYKTIYIDTMKDDSNKVLKLQQNLAELIPDKKEKIIENIKNFETRDLIRNILGELRDESLITLNKLSKIATLDQNNIKKITKERRSKIEEELGIEGLKESISEIEINSDHDKIHSIETLRKKIKKIKKEAFQKGLIINFDKEYYKSYDKLRRFLNEYYIGSPEIQKSDNKAKEIVSSIYEEFASNRKKLPSHFQDIIDRNDCDKERVIADYIASMTDSYAKEIFETSNPIGDKYKY